MPSSRLSRRNFLAGAVGTSAALALPLRLDAAPAVKKGTSLRLWILKTYVEPTNKAIEASAARWGEKHGASVTVEYFTFEDVQTKYVAAIENKNTPDVGQLETGAPARFAGMGQLIDLSTFSKQIEGEVGKPPANVAPVTIIGGKTYSIPWFIMPAFWYVWRDVFEKGKVKLPNTFEEAKAAAAALTRPKDNFYGMGQSWNRTADGYGVMQSLMYSYGVGLGEQGRQVPVHQESQDAGGREVGHRHLQGQPAAGRHAHLDRLGQQRELHRQEHRPDVQRPVSITFALENALAKATDAKEKKAREEALANHVALPHPAGPDARRMQAICMSFGIFKNSKDPEAAMSLIAHLVSPAETVRVMNDSYGQFTPVLDKARAASKEYFNKNENYRTFARAAEWFSPTGWPGPVTAAAAEVQASNVLTDMPAKVIVDKWSVDQAIDWADKKIKEIYDTIG